MSPSLNSPGTITVVPPPTPHPIIVAPVQGPPGPIGPPGDSIDALSFQHTQSTPTRLVQIIHNLPFPPAGILCLETDGSPPLLGIGVSYPSTGIVELSFGSPFTGQIFLS